MIPVVAPGAHGRGRVDDVIPMTTPSARGRGRGDDEIPVAAPGICSRTIGDTVITVAASCARGQGADPDIYGRVPGAGAQER